MNEDTKVDVPTEMVELQEENEDSKALLGDNKQPVLMDSKETVTLTWQNVNVYVQAQSKPCCKSRAPSDGPRQVLKNVCGRVKTGTLLAILGASGSGKTTLLNTLTSRTNKDAMTSSGDIKVNGVDVGHGIRNISAHVQQDDLFTATMTVKEHLTFRARLRMDKTVPIARRLQRVEEVINELGLGKCQDTKIGSPGRIEGISGGEKKRLSFASEILTNPPLLFCDEPTTGLDSFMAENIVQTLQSLSHNGKTIICTIHQPSSEVFALFNNVMVLAEGRVAFFGATDQALDFYQQVGYTCPLRFNPADFYIHTLAIVSGQETECAERIKFVCDTFESSRQYQDMVDDIHISANNPKRKGVIFEEAFSHTSRYEANYCQQMRCVLLRSWRVMVREPTIIRIRLIQNIFVALVLGLVYMQLDVSQQGVQDFNGAIFIILAQTAFGCLTSVINSFPEESRIFLGEYKDALYRSDVYFISNVLVEVPMSVILPTIYSVITYWMIGFHPSAEAFITYTLVVILITNTVLSYVIAFTAIFYVVITGLAINLAGYVVSVAVTSVTAAVAIAPVPQLVFLLFGGFALNVGSIPVYLKWLEYISWFRYATELLLVNQWRNVDHIGEYKRYRTFDLRVTVYHKTNDPSCIFRFNMNDCGQGTNVTNGTGGTRDTCFFKDGAAVLEYYNFDEANVRLDVGLLVTIMIVLRLLAFIILFLKARKSKH